MCIHIPSDALSDHACLFILKLVAINVHKLFTVVSRIGTYDKQFARANHNHDLCNEKSDFISFFRAATSGRTNNLRAL